MGIVVSFQSYRPAPRFDGDPWIAARVEEAASPAGPWTAIDTIALVPDPDPSQPQLRSLTSENGTAPARWYQIVFLDAESDESLPTDPVQNVAETDVALDPDVLCDFKLTKELIGWKQSSTATDALQRMIMNGVSALIHDWTGRQFVKDSAAATLRYLLEYDDVADRSLMIDDLSAPATAIVIKWRDGTLVQNLDLALVDQLRHTRRPGWPIVELGFVPGFANSAQLGPRLAVDVTGVWGWPAVPADVTNFAMQTTAAWCIRELNKFSASFRLDAQRVEIPRVLPDTVKSGLKLFRRTPIAGSQVGVELA